MFAAIKFKLSALITGFSKFVSVIPFMKLTLDNQQFQVGSGNQLFFFNQSCNYLFGKIWKYWCFIIKKMQLQEYVQHDIAKEFPKQWQWPISPTFYQQLFRAQNPKVQKRTDDLTVFLHIKLLVNMCQFPQHSMSRSKSWKHKKGSQVVSLLRFGDLGKQKLLVERSWNWTLVGDFVNWFLN